MVDSLSGMPDSTLSREMSKAPAYTEYSLQVMYQYLGFSQEYEQDTFPLVYVLLLINPSPGSSVVSIILSFLFPMFSFSSTLGFSKNMSLLLFPGSTFFHW